ncbi:F-type H+-transporting ATPase subunit a [Caldicoprobacter guelmensis]|uniref:F0F1 ATP synthase subunit A n=1 Tax=Caldicoprobacter guelmensis TaxID=1170224 RepID=UPI00195C89E0|nr:FoF1 ATP synthase subunit a [Caldicoprobacter guelmensis]MBM7581505.1 F-type H+-transporting ATPase subunit a [Caldicoprobacter guelmensis]
MEGIDINPKVWFTIPIMDGIPVTDAVCISWIVSVGLIIFAFVVRFYIFPRFQEVPTGFQNILELLVEWVYSFSRDTVHEFSRELAPYIGTLVLYLGFANTIELLGLRPPTTYIATTFALSIITFFLINVYGIRKKGLWGRIKDYGKPVPFIAPIKVLTDLAVPVSLASRMFGNILGGLVVMELIYKVVPVVIPSFLSIYFTLFDGFIQTFIFITLSLTFIGEAIE